jgi:hypothetical protein
MTLKFDQFNMVLPPEKPCCRMIVAGPSEAGKSQFLLHFMRANRKKYFTTWVFCGSGGVNPQYRNITHPAMIYDSYKADVLEAIFDTHDQNIKRAGGYDPTNLSHNMMIVLDDIFGQAREVKNSTIIDRIFTEGRQRGISIVVLIQSMSKQILSPAVRPNISYFVILPGTDVFYGNLSDFFPSGTILSKPSTLAKIFTKLSAKATAIKEEGTKFINYALIYNDAGLAYYAVHAFNRPFVSGSKSFLSLVNQLYDPNYQEKQQNKVVVNI